VDFPVTLSCRVNTVIRHHIPTKENIMRSKNQLRLLGAFALFGGMVTSGIALSGAAGAQSFAAPDSHALFVETDSPAGNAILSYVRASDGTISLAGTYGTGGKGGAGANSSAAPLGSQDGLTLVDNNQELIATNAGSDSVSLFAVSGTHLRLIQQAPSGGLFPDSIASHGNLVAVLNAGGAGAVQEFSLEKGKLTTLADENRSLGLDNTTPPDYVHGAGQVGYTPNGEHVVVTTKDSTNSYDVFSVSSGGVLGAAPVISASDNPVPYDFNFDAAGNLFAIEAGTSSASVYSVNANGTLTSLGTVSDNAKALCWISSANGYFYGSNAGSSTITSFDETSTGAPQVLASVAATAHAGTTDLVVSPDGKFLYVESGGAGTIDVFAIGSSAALTLVTTIFDIPTASEGIAIS
jgi:6-phosphogluconolactonase (cycloisomerase 2 family)